MQSAEKIRTSITMDEDLYQKILDMRAKKEYQRMSVSGIINEILRETLEGQLTENPAR